MSARVPLSKRPWRRVGRCAVVAAAVGAAAAVVTAVGDARAWASAIAETQDLVDVVGRIRTVLVSLAAAVATLLLTIGGMRWLLAGGDPGEVDKAKRALTGSGIGYGIAVLATVLMAILDYIVGDPGE